jgi:hypothetical protein
MRPSLFIFSVLIYLSSCGPPAEKRERMDYIARRTADSIQIYLDSALNDPVKELMTNGS